VRRLDEAGAGQAPGHPPAAASSGPSRERLTETAGRPSLSGFRPPPCGRRARRPLIRPPVFLRVCVPCRPGAGASPFPAQRHEQNPLARRSGAPGRRRRGPPGPPRWLGGRLARARQRCEPGPCASRSARSPPRDRGFTDARLGAGRDTRRGGRGPRRSPNPTQRVQARERADRVAQPSTPAARAGRRRVSSRNGSRIQL
jgi:hypothetical protein